MGENDQAYDTARLDQVFPLPFRITAAVALGVWCWGFNIYGLQAAHIDTCSTIQYKDDASDESVKLYLGVFKLALQVTAALGVGVLVFWAQTNDSVLVGGLPWATLLTALAVLFNPRSDGKERFVNVCWRIIRGGIDKENRLPDILAADALTSYAKIIVDLGVALSSMYLGKSTFDEPDRSGNFIVPLCNALPFLIRLSQCFWDYQNTGKFLHLLNWAKYFTSLPMIYMATVVKNGSSTISPGTAKGLWCFCAFVNSTYSYIWDVRVDWDLNFAHGSRLRPVLYFESKLVYVAAVLIDLCLRYAWTLKPVFGSTLPDTELGYYILTLVEILRRWMWVYFRVESDWAAHGGRPKRLPLNTHEMHAME